MRVSIDTSGRALLSVSIRPNPTQRATTFEIWIDTGFTGELVLPQVTIDALGLVHSGSVDAILADGSAIKLNTYTCHVDWFGGQKRLEVVANSGMYPLLGVGLLRGLELRRN